MHSLETRLARVFHHSVCLYHLKEPAGLKPGFLHLAMSAGNAIYRTLNPSLKNEYHSEHSDLTPANWAIGNETLAG